MTDKKEQEKALMKKAEEQLPVSKDDVSDGVHPMAKGIRSAKACINEILKDADNLTKLRGALQGMFDEDPIAFLLRFEDLMDKYDKVEEEKDEQKQTVRLYMRQDNGSESAVEFTKEDG